MATTFQKIKVTMNSMKQYYLLLTVGVIFCSGVAGRKYIYATENDCDRQSLDALYFEKYKLLTDDILSDNVEFVSRVVDLVLDSLTSVMAALPGRDSSDQSEKELYLKYNALKKKFTRNVNKVKKNITSAWEELLSANQDMLLDKKPSDLFTVRNKTNILVESYKHARTTLDSKLGDVISVIKAVVSGGSIGIKSAAESEIRKEFKTKLKASNGSLTHEQLEKEANEMKINEEELLNKMKNITQDIVPRFLCKVTLLVFDKGIDLQKQVESTAVRENDLDDICFDLTMIQSKVIVEAQDVAQKNKELRDLGRRNIYMHWSSLTSSMYKKKIRQQAAPSLGEEMKHKKKWEDEELLAETLVRLLEAYP